MPKMKTKSGAAKRFRIKKSGKIKRNKPNSSHLLSKKSAKRKRFLRQAENVDKTDVKRIKVSLPYG